MAARRNASRVRSPFVVWSSGEARSGPRRDHGRALPSEDRVRGLDSGADDYLTKPFEFVELAARLRALRRRDSIGASRLDIGGLLVDLTRHSVTWKGAEARLSGTEFDLVRLLADNQQRVMPRAEILETIWGSASYIEPNIVDQYVRYVRKKLDQIGSGTLILNVRGQGFQFAGKA